MAKRKGSRNLYERGGVWWARSKVAGRDVRRNLFTSDRKIAERRLKAFLEEVDRARAGEEPRIAYADAVVAWAGAGYGVASPTTQRRYRVSLSMLDADFGALFRAMKLSDPQFHDDEAARLHFEALRWGGTPACGKCGVVGQAKETARAGRYRCNACRKDFTVTTGTVMESSHIGLSKWAWTFYMMAASKKGISAHQVHRSLGITYRSAWFMCHRVRLAMAHASCRRPFGRDD